MSEMTASDQLQQLEQKAVKYAIAVEARDAIHGQLKYWAAIVGIAGASAGWFGFSLHSQLHELTETVKTQTTLAEELKKKTDELKSTVDARKEEFEKFTAAMNAKQTALDGRAVQLAEKTEKLSDNTYRLAESAGAVALRAADFDAASKAALAAIQQTTNNSAEQASRITEMKKAVEADAKSAETYALELGQTMQLARSFNQSIEGQRQVFRNALLDYVTMTKDATSPEILLSTADPNLHYRVRFTTPKDMRRTGFTMSYNVNECRGPATVTSPCDVISTKSSDKVMKFTRNERAWIPLEGTDEKYQFALDYIFTAKLARNYVTIRVGATDRLLPQLGPGPQAVKKEG
jgi:uncharacterized phage infection (PIP) family protein YhgE